MIQSDSVILKENLQENIMTQFYTDFKNKTSGKKSFAVMKNEYNSYGKNKFATNFERFSIIEKMFVLEN